MLDSKEVPQADVLSDVIETVVCVYDHPGCDDSMIARHITKVKRQGRYYRHAAELLGLITNHQNSASIAPDGERFLRMTHHDRMDFLKQRIMNLAVFQLTENLIRINPGCRESDIAQLLTDEGITLSTGDRRTNTLISWLKDLDIIRQDGETFYII